MDGIYMLIKGRQWKALKDRLEREPHPDRALRLACRELAHEEVLKNSSHFGVPAGYPEIFYERTQAIFDQTRARMEAAG